MDWRHSDKQKYFRHIWHWKAKRLKKEQNKARNRKQSKIFHIHFNMKQWKFPNSSSHTVINRQEDVIIETVFIEGLTKKFFFPWYQTTSYFGVRPWYCQFLSVAQSVWHVLWAVERHLFTNNLILLLIRKITGLKLWGACL